MTFNKTKQRNGAKPVSENRKVSNVVLNEVDQTASSKAATCGSLLKGWLQHQLLLPSPSVQQLFGTDNKYVSGCRRMKSARQCRFGIQPRTEQLLLRLYR